MNSGDCITWSSSSSQSDPLQGQLKNVFRILAKPEHELRVEALKLRQKVSSTWRMRAAQDKWFPWPTTTAFRGNGTLKARWRPHGMLGFLGYHVGETQPTPSGMRRCILEYAFECDLPPLNDRAYYLEWGNPRTPRRLNKLANTLAALTRNAKRRDAVSYAKAIDDWEHDLALLRERYYLDFFHFGWPATVSLH
jgi:hypothetical protein